jgi:hypothetical protein
MIVATLAQVQRLMEAGSRIIERGKQYLRWLLGPGPQNYVLYDNGDIVPEGVWIPALHERSLLYIQDMSRIIDRNAAQQVMKRLPWISIVYHGAHGTVDLTEWIANIRCTDTRTPSLKQMIHLGFLVQKEYLEERNAKIVTLDRAGEEHQYEYSGEVHLREMIAPEADAQTE